MTIKKQNASKPNHFSFLENGGVYEIKIKGHLDEHWKQWFEGMDLVKVTNGETGQECTLLTGAIVDQPALHGVLAKIRDLNLNLISVRKIASQDKRNRGEDHDDASTGHHRMSDHE